LVGQKGVKGIGARGNLDQKTLGTQFAAEIFGGKKKGPRKGEKPCGHPKVC